MFCSTVRYYFSTGMYSTSARISHPHRLSIGYVVLILVAALAGLPAASETARAQEAGGKRYALLIGGLGGSVEHTEKFKGYLFDTRKALVETFGFPAEQVVVLGETRIGEEAFVDGVSNADNIRAQFEALRTRVSGSDEVYVILFGHGGYEGGESRLNIPRRDLSQNDFAQLVDALDAGRLVFINTGSASAPFAEALSADGRIVITATRTGTQKNETSFPRFMIESFANPGTDRDKDGRISVGEVFYYAAEKTQQWFDDNGNIPTENALLADTGDGQGYRLDEIEGAGAGHLASITYLSPSQTPAIAATGEVDADLAAWLNEKSEIELEIAELKSQKAGMEEDAYYDRLEVLFVRLAKGNERAEAP